MCRRFLESCFGNFITVTGTEQRGRKLFYSYLPFIVRTISYYAHVYLRNYVLNGIVDSTVDGVLYLGTAYLL